MDNLQTPVIGKSIPEKNSRHKYLFALGALLLVGILILAAVVIFSGSKKAANISSPQEKKPPVELKVYFMPGDGVVALEEKKKFTLRADFPMPSDTDKLGSFKAVLSLPSAYLIIPKGEYIDTSKSGFNRIIRVDGPTVSNESGEITIELSSDPASAGPGTNKPINLAEIVLSGKSKTDTFQEVAIKSINVTDSIGQNLPVNFENLRLSVN